MIREVNMLGYLSADIICSTDEMFFSRKTVSFEEQILSKDKYQSIFLCQMQAIWFIIFQNTFCNMSSFENWGI